MTRKVYDKMKKEFRLQGIWHWRKNFSYSYGWIITTQKTEYRLLFILILDS
jgi:hypothetical protein